MGGLIPREDLEFSAYNPRPGGQQVGTPSGVKAEHLPTGTIAIVQTHRSMHKNREIAVRMIEAALTDPRPRARGRTVTTGGINEDRILR